jgi:hypothetical protein
MTNRYPGQCHSCGSRVRKYAGRCFKPAGARRYVVECVDCSGGGSTSPSSEVVEFYFPSTGSYAYQNRNGRCEDAPCCGCCTC